MAYSKELAESVRTVIGGREQVGERKMFGSIAWMVNGHMACGVRGEDLFVRLDPEDAERALAEPYVSRAEFSGRTMGGVITVGGEVLGDPAELARWIDACADHAASRPPK